MLLALCSSHALAGSREAAEPAVRLAMVRAIRARMGQAAAVRLDDVKVALAAPADWATLQCAVEPGARLGRPVRFTLTAEQERAGRRTRTRVGHALASISVAIDHVRTARAVPRGHVLTASDLNLIDGEVSHVSLAPLPVLADLAGARAVRDLRVNEILTTQIAKLPPLVRSGDTVRTHAIIGFVEVTGAAVAQQSGRRNDRIRVINPQSQRLMTGVVTGPGEVEVLHEK
ncbi:MAG: flagellar basal body P-ring formation chaperone FlgA [Acidobacteriota bacterium]